MGGHVSSYETKTKGTLWRIAVRWTDASGKAHRHDERGFPSRRAAEKAARDVLSAAEGDTYVPASRVTMGAFLVDQWLPAIEATVRANTYRNYENEVRLHIVPTLGRVQLQALTPVDVQRLYRGLGRSLAPKTVRNVGGTFGTAMEDAVKWGLVTRNVVRLVDRPAAEDVEIEAWTAGELRTFLTSVSGDPLSSLWTLMATTGLRRGEALGLRWRDVDLDVGQLAVRQSITTVNGEVVTGPPKTRSSVRTMRLDAHTVSVLRSHRVRQARERLEAGPSWHDGDLVFTREDGTALRPDGVSRTFSKAAASAGLPDIGGPHGLRHGYATVSLQAGVPLKVVSGRLGHSSVAITADRYSHVTPAWDQQAADTTATAIFGGA